MHVISKKITKVSLGDSVKTGENGRKVVEKSQESVKMCDYTRKECENCD